MGNLGNAWRDLGEPARARDLIQRALTIEEREYGPDHVELARTLNNLAAAWYELGEPAKARDLHQRALTLQEREYGPDHPELARTMGSLGTVLLGLGEPAKARDLIQLALTIERRHYPDGHPVTMTLITMPRRAAPDLVVLHDGSVLTEPETQRGKQAPP